MKGVQSEGEWEWDTANIIAAIRKQPTHIMYILILMTEVYVFGCNSHLRTLQCNTRSCICMTHNMSTRRGKQKHTNKHGPPHIHLLYGMRSHITTRSRGGAVDNTHCQSCTSCSAQLNTHHTRALCRQQCTPDRQ